MEIKQPRATKQSILDAALTLFSEHGYTGTSVRQIARLVGIRESSLYVYFKSKAEILETLCASFGPASALETINLIIKEYPNRTYHENLVEITNKMLDSWARPSECKFARLMHMESALNNTNSHRNQAITLIKKAKVILKSYFVHLIENKLIKDLDPEFLVYEYWGFLHFVHVEMIISGHESIDVKPFKKLVNQHLEFFCQNISRSQGEKYAISTKDKK